MIFSSLREIRREFGAAKSAAIAARWLVRVSYETFVFEHGDDRDYPPRPALEGLRVTTVGERDLARLATIQPGVDERELRRRLAAGLNGTLVWEGDEIVHARWDGAVDHLVPYLGLTLHLHPGDHHRMSSFTRPEFRDRRIHSRMVAWSLHSTRDQGSLRSIGLVSDWNEPALRAMVRNRWRRVGAIGFWRLGPFRHYVVSGGVRLGAGRSFSVDPSAPAAGSPARTQRAGTPSD